MTFFLVAACLAAEPLPNPTFVGGGAVASPDGKLVFAPAKGGGIEAIDLATGKPLWTNKDASKLAGASDKLVLGWINDEKKGNAFRVVAFDAATGKTLAKSEPVVMADWASTANQFGRSFRTAARADGDKLFVVWQANTFYFGGARPTPEIEAAARKEATGAASIDLATGKVTAVDRKLKGEEFGGFAAKVGDLDIQVTEMIPGFKPGAPMVTTVTLAVLKDKKELWKRELAGNPWSPPPP